MEEVLNGLWCAEYTVGADDDRISFRRIVAARCVILCRRLPCSWSPWRRRLLFLSLGKTDPQIFAHDKRVMAAGEEPWRVVVGMQKDGW